MKRIQMYVKGMQYPCLKEELVCEATRQGADDATIGVLQSLSLEFFPDHRAFKNCLLAS